jgi:hypothetical protein
MIRDCLRGGLLAALVLAGGAVADILMYDPRHDRDALVEPEPLACSSAAGNCVVVHLPEDPEEGACVRIMPNHLAANAAAVVVGGGHSIYAAMDDYYPYIVLDGSREKVDFEFRDGSWEMRSCMDETRGD